MSKHETIDASSPEALAQLPLERLAGIASDLISDMACIEIALTGTPSQVAESAALHPDADCYETVGKVRAMRRRHDAEDAVVKALEVCVVDGYLYSEALPEILAQALERWRKVVRP